MKQYLKSYQMKLTVLGPVFVGSGRELSKKEYMFLPGRKIGVVDIEKLYPFLQKKGKQQEFDDFLLKDFRTDLKHWVMEQEISAEEILPYMKYILGSGDTSLVRGTKAQIMECVKDAYGKPYVPGSSIKGMLRTILLSADILTNQGQYNPEKKAVLAGAEANKGRTAYLAKEKKQIEVKALHTLKRKIEKREDAVNDSLAGLIISDSEPLSMKDVVLCQKVERHVNGTEKNLNLLRECIRPGTEIYFTITIDESLCKLTIPKIMEAIKIFADNYYEKFLASFQGMDIPTANSVYLGGGSGFASKTLVYSMFGKKEGIRLIQKIFLHTNVPRMHKHDKDSEYGAAPHIVKCTKYQGQTVQMGLCTLSER